jgi:Fe2+ transport system protein B
MKQSSDPLAIAIGSALGQVTSALEAKIALVVALLFKAGIIDREMVVETIRQHLQIHENEYVRESLEDMLRIWEQGGPTFTVIDGGKQD